MLTLLRVPFLEGDAPLAHALIEARGPRHIKQANRVLVSQPARRLGHTGVNPSRKRLRVRVRPGFAVTG